MKYAAQNDSRGRIQTQTHEEVGKAVEDAQKLPSDVDTQISWVGNGGEPLKTALALQWQWQRLTGVLYVCVSVKT